MKSVSMIALAGSSVNATECDASNGTLTYIAKGGACVDDDDTYLNAFLNVSHEFCQQKCTERADCKSYEWNAAKECVLRSQFAPVNWECKAWNSYEKYYECKNAPLVRNFTNFNNVKVEETQYTKGKGWNDWHFVTITNPSGDLINYEWHNRAGKMWRLAAQYDMQGYLKSFATGPDCPYLSAGHTHAELIKNGHQVTGIRGPYNEPYQIVNDFSINPAGVKGPLSPKTLTLKKTYLTNWDKVGWAPPRKAPPPPQVDGDSDDDFAALDAHLPTNLNMDMVNEGGDYENMAGPMFFGFTAVALVVGGGLYLGRNYNKHDMNTKEGGEKESKKVFKEQIKSTKKALKADVKESLVVENDI